MPEKSPPSALAPGHEPGRPPLRPVMDRDARPAVLLTALMGVLAWKAGAPALCLYLAAMSPLFLRVECRRRMPPGTARRTLLFALAWPLLKFVMDAVSVFRTEWTHVSGFLGGGGPPEASASLLTVCGPGLGVAGEEAGLLFLRLLVILGAALALTFSFSPPAIALAVSRFLRPLAGRRAWTAALALALMARYVPRIHALCAQTKIAAQSRGLPRRGLARLRIWLPHVFRLLACDTWTQALALASRRLDVPEAWQSRAPLEARAAFGVVFAGAGAVLLACAA